MELIRGIHNLEPRHRGGVATIGNFDGVHRGHARLLERTHRAAAELAVPACVVTFEPHSKEFFAPDKAPPRLTDLRGKVQALQDAGMARLLVLRFDWPLAGLEPRAFIDRVLVAGLGVRHVVVGHDFAFGRGAKGGFADLEAAGRALGFVTEEVPELRLEDRAVGSTAVRGALAEGDLEEARFLLGRPYSLCGRVVAGDRVGRGLGFPTANLHTRHHRLPLAGVYAARVNGPGLTDRPAAVNVGHRPTVHGADVRLEAHILDGAPDLYGALLEVTFERRLRAERAFADLEALKAQIGEDVRQTRAHFGLARS